MENDNCFNIPAEHLDIFKEVSNIGAGNAATALAKLLDRKVNVGIPKVEFLEFHEVAMLIGGPDKVYVGVLVNLSEDLSGMMMFLLDVASVNVLISSLLGSKRDGSSIAFTEMEVSFVKEIGNILSASYLTSLATLTNLKILPSIPYMAVDMANAILSVPAIEFGKVSDRALFIESVLGSDDGQSGQDVRGYFLLIPDLDSFDIILRALGVK